MLYSLWGAVMHISEILVLRDRLGESQTVFWERFGVNQRTASRIERGQAMPNSLAILVRLFFDGVVNDADLARAYRRYRISLNRLPTPITPQDEAIPT